MYIVIEYKVWPSILINFEILKFNQPVFQVELCTCSGSLDCFNLLPVDGSIFTGCHGYHEPIINLEAGKEFMNSTGMICRDNGFHENLSF